LHRGRALQVVDNLPCPVLPGQGRAGQVTLGTGQGRVRLRNFLQGRLQVMYVVTCQPATNFAYQILSTSFLKLYIKKRIEVS